MTILFFLDVEREAFGSISDRYEDRYGNYLAFFFRISNLPGSTNVILKNVPSSWAPLLLYLGCSIESFSTDIFYHDTSVLWALNSFSTAKVTSSYEDKPIVSIEDYPKFDRTFLDVMCGFRPETTDALWKIDRQPEWQTERVVSARARFDLQTEFIVTTNGSFHRPEIDAYNQQLSQYRPSKENVILVPCAADKPYPSPMHYAVMNIIEDTDSWYLANATGVLGIVPDDLWYCMPHYDSGVPNEWRLMNIARDYFTRHQHKRVVCYTDYYNLALYHALMGLDPTLKPDVSFVLPVGFYYDYQNLLSLDNLTLLYASLYPGSDDALNSIKALMSDGGISKDTAPPAVISALDKVMSKFPSLPSLY